MRPADTYQGVGESLQADVMRFMAIIAFCLIAILALVRGVEPPPAATAANGAFEAPREVLPVPAEAAADAGRLVPDAPAPEPVLPRESAPMPEVTPLPPAPRPEPAPTPERVVQPAPAAGTARPAEPAAKASPPPAEPRAEPESSDEGLSLRFAREQDFLQLVNRGGIELYAFNDAGQVLSVSADFRFRPAAQAPGHLHELLPSTIPERMTAALRTRHDGSYRWGIAMPERMARRVREFVERGATGELVIDRYGEVRHRER